MDVSTTRFDQAIQPYVDNSLPYSEQGSCYKLKLASDAYQYFYVTAHNRSSNWERYWPNSGLLAWRRIENWWADMQRRFPRNLEVEPESGHWNYEIVGGHPYTYYAGQSLMHDTLDVVRFDSVPNSETGMDSMDFVFTMRSDTHSFMFAAAAGYRGEGGSSSFFGPGTFMDDHTNPTSRFVTRITPLNVRRNRNTGIALRNIRVEANGNYTADLIANSWQGTMTHPHAWFDTVRVAGTLNTAPGSVLTVNPGTLVSFSQNGYLDISGTLQAKGTEAEPIIFEFPSNTGNGGIYFVNADSVELVHCIFKRAPVVFIQGGDYTWINNCTFDSCFYGLEAYDVTTANSLIEHNLFTHCRYGILGLASAGTFENNVLESCDKVGIYWSGDRTTGERARFTGNEVRASGFMVPWWGGGFFSGTTALLECNLFEHNWKNQITCTNNANIVMNGNYSGLGKNKLIDTVTVTWCGSCNPYCVCVGVPSNFRPLLKLNNSFPALGRGNNAFRLNPLGNTNNGGLVFDESQRCSITFVHDLKENYYEIGGTLADPPGPGNDHFCPDTAFVDIAPATAEISCVEFPLAGLNVPEAAYQTAAAKEQTGDFAGASDDYAAVIDQYPGTSQAIWSARGYLRTGLADAVPATQRHDELLAIWATDSLAGELRRAARCEAVWALLAAAHFDEARNELDAIRNDPTSGEDSSWAVETAQLVDFMDAGAGALSVGAQAQSVRNRLQVFHERLEQSAAEATIEDELSVHETVAAPLATAHPNPFNNSVAIELTLPEAGLATVEIYNLLGQKVTTLLDKRLDAGLTRLNWNASAAAAGVYLYRVEFAGRVETHKVMLLK
ncbi:T9SS type A sorting domain-containing protein [candidate division KSB1 bacterium]|nr:T9SS type A sorting domain-containing protein [candidate division KSB1 bacterium]